jgi:murein DD-endopeptidase MepM/ murein hydrolase activator NlpD
MKNRNNKIVFIIIFLLVTFIVRPNFVIGENQESTNTEVKALNNEIQKKKNQLDNIKEEQEKYSNKIKNTQKEQASLSNQMYILDNRILKSELDIQETNIEIERVNLEIKKTNLEIDDKNLQIENEREHIGNILKLMYKQKRANTLEILLLNDSLTDFLNQIKYLEDVNDEVSESLTDLEKNKTQLEKSIKNLNEKNNELISLKKDLENKKLTLESEQKSKEYIMDEVVNSEKKYQTLLQAAKDEQAQAAADITNLEKKVRSRMANLSGKKLEFNDNGIIWPVPKNIITTYFHDPEYPFRYLFEHPAVDIRAGQGTPLKAAASGYVARAKDAGLGYSYIMIVHGDGLSTVYGHVSKIYVQEDEYVVQGQTIGLSGGAPGTVGAGRLTTGSHLHFEVRLNGIPVNPLEYLQ